MTTNDHDLKESIAQELDVARQRSLGLLAPLDDALLCRQHSPLMSPLVWDLAHVGNYEDLWLLRGLGEAGVGDRYDDIYDAFRHARADRPGLALLDPTGARRYIADVRGRVLDRLDRLDRAPLVSAETSELVADGFVYGMVVQHEHQHDETMLATLQLMAGPGYRPSATARPAGRRSLTSEAFVPGGPFVMGTTIEPWAYDNERPAHVVEVAPFFIDIAPVTNAAFCAFIAGGGYDEPHWWTASGWRWRQDVAAVAPLFWQADGAGGWTRNRFGFVEAVPGDEPVQHVSWFEADAYARWAGRRLPTEAEWEKAASWDPATATKRRYPWGDQSPSDALANVGGGAFGPAPVGAFAGGASAVGCEQMIGDVWEWTDSDFLGYPAFRSFPYREYSEVFFGAAYKVLRGGSWATHPLAIRNTFRNWDYPIRRQIFAGFRTARSAA
jgi:iron(II)-dependent oxidoreductase